LKFVDSTITANNGGNLHCVKCTTDAVNTSCNCGTCG